MTTADQKFYGLRGQLFDIDVSPLSISDDEGMYRLKNILDDIAAVAKEWGYNDTSMELIYELNYKHGFVYLKLLRLHEDSSDFVVDISLTIDDIYGASLNVRKVILE